MSAVEVKGRSEEAAAAVLALERLVEEAKAREAEAAVRREKCDGSEDIAEHCDWSEAQAASEALECVRAALIQAREAKQKMEEMDCGITRSLNAEQATYPQHGLTALRKLVKGVRPSHMKETERESIVAALLEEEKKSGREVLFVLLESNAWFDAIYEERMASSKRNGLFFVYRRESSLFLSHRGDKGDATESVSAEAFGADAGWLEGREIRWLCQQLAGGSNARVLQALLASKGARAGERAEGSAVLYESDAWKALVELCFRGCGRERLFSKRLLSVCVTQASNFLSDRDSRVKIDKKKAKQERDKRQKEIAAGVDVPAFTMPPHLRLKAAAREDLFLFCQTWSMLAAIERYLSSGRWDLSPPLSVGDGLSPEFGEAWEQLQSLKKAIVPEKEYALFVAAWKASDRLSAIVAKSSLPDRVDKAFGGELEEWMGATRAAKLEQELTAALATREDLLEEKETVTPCHIICDTDEKLTELLNEIGPPLTQQEGTLLYLAEGGSRMYNLSTPESDSDFVGVFLWKTSSVLSSIGKKKESAENKGKQARIEHSCFEARMMADMLLKGNPNVIELLFAPSAHYCSKEFELLRQHRRRLISEYVMVQYDSWVKWHIARIRSSAKEDRAGKLFYHALHKLAGLQCLARGDNPIVVMQDGPSPLADDEICQRIRDGRITRDVILRIRKGPLTGPLAVSSLLEAVSERHTAVKAVIKARSWRYPEWGDQGLLTHWLLLMRLRSHSSTT
eukprot:CAMPEP_0114632148 /NCGR_PEP_ID=MMETSP0168-20121206/14778_1 /TAXON_ID=95228 ORGANISM="Vannella sp., Strain DIVA3 517/6/12" /NCGR_SAMPLE_ID=MMETSP0168 /ASSEMBLY_ACC=CAM_ASM_000044 /LENGTH=738 /DNA_ID=CAMNT_0001843735 /DNA_START=42 /DNA_END=2255 /DNA_ORIENTATION=+